MILDTTTRKLQVNLSAVATSASMPVVVDWVDSTTTTFNPGVTPSNTNGTTLVDILAAPASATQRKVNGITIHNLDTAAKTVLVYLNDNGTNYQLIDAILQVSDTLGYTDVNGWYVMDSSGAIKGVGPTGATGATGTNGATGATGMPGLDGEDGQDGIPIPGAQGIAGVAGSTGPQGPIGFGLPGEDGEDALHIPGPKGDKGDTGSAGTGGEYGKMVAENCTQASGALTFTMPSLSMDFRSTTLTSGTITTVTGTPADLVLPSGATLGAVTTVSARIVRVLINNAGTLEQAIVNLAGGNDLSETGAINTTAIDTGSDSANVFYSITARTGVAYKVVGIVDAVNTAGAWGSPTLVQGAGGQAVTAMSSLGYGQSWQTVTRTTGVTYYNTTGKPITVVIGCVLPTNGNITPIVNSYTLPIISNGNIGAQNFAYSFIVPINGSYSSGGNTATQLASELR